VENTGEDFEGFERKRGLVILSQNILLYKERYLPKNAKTYIYRI